MKSYWHSIVLFIVISKDVHSENDFANVPQQHRDKVQEVKKMIEGNLTLVILLRTNWPPHINNTRCWKSRKNSTGVFMPQQYLKYEQKLTGSQGWEKRNLLALYAAGLRGGGIPTFAMFTYGEGMKPDKDTTGYFTILYAKRPCFVVQSQADPSICLTWVRRRRIDIVRQECAAIFYAACVNSTTVVQKYNRTVCEQGLELP
uniref:Lipocalin n=1 Tax=Rhipicephalus appendiculatus TaxID=34631 RepID=A0A131Z6L2_RHIAP